MTRAWVRQEVRPLRFEARNERRQQRILTRAEAGEMLGVTERVAANRYLTEQVLPQHNKRVRATEPRPACIAWVGTSLAEGLGVQDERVVATGNR